VLDERSLPLWHRPGAIWAATALFFWWRGMDGATVIEPLRPNSARALARALDDTDRTRWSKAPQPSYRGLSHLQKPLTLNSVRPGPQWVRNQKTGSLRVIVAKII
jgi:hypothetical protein